MGRHAIQRTRGTVVLLATVMLGALAARVAPRTSDVDDEGWRQVADHRRHVRS